MPEDLCGAAAPAESSAESARRLHARPSDVPPPSDCSTSFGKTGLAAVAFAIDQFQQFFVQNIVAEEVGQSHDGLLHGADALHDLSALPHQLTQFIVRSLDYLLNMGIIAAWKVLARILPDIHIGPPQRLLAKLERLRRTPSHLRYATHLRGVPCSVMQTALPGCRFRRGPYQKVLA